jgi:Flp pilus assembly protein TadD
LNWFAEKYYWKAEKNYQAQMEAYEKNRTRKQYAILLREFKLVSSDFREALNYFSKLYRLYPDPEYARYLGNIYARLNDGQKARYYHGKARL